VNEWWAVGRDPAVLLCGGGGGGGGGGWWVFLGGGGGGGGGEHLIIIIKYKYDLHLPSYAPCISLPHKYVLCMGTITIAALYTIL